MEIANVINNAFSTSWEGRSTNVAPRQNALQPRQMPDEIVLSPDARRALDEDESGGIQKMEEASAENLTPEEESQVAELKQRDAEVRAHEAAHLSAGSGVVRSGAKFEYTTGPDGRQYITGGEVAIDVAPAGEPEQTIQKMQQVRRSALAPAQPSGADRSVAAHASQLEAQARMELAQARTEKTEDEDAAVTGNDLQNSIGQDRVSFFDQMV